MKVKTKGKKKSQRPRVGLIRVGSPTKERWKGWRTYEKPSKVVTYNLKDLEENK
jgi:hypothetical protein